MSWQPGHDPTVRLRDDAAVDEVVADRSSRRQLRQMAAESATFSGTLRDLAERRAGVTMTTDDDRDLQGRLVAVSSDHVVLVTPNRQRVHLRTDAIHTLRPDPSLRADIAQGERPPAQDIQLLERLALWEADRPSVALVVRGRRDLIRGQLVAVGNDLVTVLVDGGGQAVYVVADAIRAVMTDLR